MSRLFQGFLDNMQGMAIIKNSELSPLFVNRLFREHFPDAEFPDKGPHALSQNSDNVDMIQKTDRQALSNGSAIFEEEWKENDGTVRTLEIRKFAIHRSDAPPHLGTIIHDITNRKRFEKHCKTPKSSNRWVSWRAVSRTISITFSEAYSA